MSKILVLQSSINGKQSRTNSLMDTFLAERKSRGYTDEVTVRDLPAMRLPVLDRELFQALRGQANHQEHIQEGVALSESTSLS